MHTLTAPQLKMLTTIDNSVVRSSGHQVWMIDGRPATAAESRVITALQTKRLVKWESQEVTIAGWVGSKRVFRLIRK